MHETYLKETPWICLTYPVSDAEADANGGQSKVVFDCCICGVKEVCEFILPAQNDPVWQEIDPQVGLPEAEAMRRTFQLAHLHEGQHDQPMLTWAKPLRNVDALRGGVDMEQLKERLLGEIEKSKWPSEL